MNKRKKSYVGLLVISLLFPIVGLILLLMLKDDKDKEKNLRIGTVLGFILLPVFYFIVIPFLYRGNGSTCNTYGPDYRATEGTYIGKDGKEYNTWCCCPGKKKTCSEDEGCIVVKEEEK